MGFLNGLLLYAVLPFVAINTTLLALSYALPPTLGNGHPRRLSAFFARCMAFLGCLTLCAIYGTIASLLLTVVGYGGLGQWTTARAFKWSMWAASGVWFDIEDPKAQLGKRPIVLVGNHQTELDILFLGALFPKYTSVTSKRSLKWTPFLGQFMWASKTVFIDRANSKSARAAFDSAANQIRSARQSVYIFPEGTRSYSTSPMLLPFKKGAFHLAVQAQVPVVPVVAENYSHVLVLRGGWKRWRFEAGTVRVRVLKSVETKGLGPEAVGGMAEEVRGKMLETIEELGQERTRVPVTMKANGKAE